MARRIFSFDQARQLLPDVKRLTADAVRRAEALASRVQELALDDPARARLDGELADVVNGWADAIRTLGLEAKGLWLVDFDNGEGYYCWCYPEDALTHYHTYEEGFAGRMKIV
jgi:hypothetical protein